MPAHDEKSSARLAASATLDVVPALMYLLRSVAKKHCDAGLSMPQLRALGFIRRYPGHPLSWLAEQLGLTVSATSRLVDGLVSRGFITRTPSRLKIGAKSPSR